MNDSWLSRREAGRPVVDEKDLERPSRRGQRLGDPSREAMASGVWPGACRTVTGVDPSDKVWLSGTRCAARTVFDAGCAIIEDVRILSLS